MTICPYALMLISKEGNMGKWRYRKMAIWESGDIAIWQEGNKKNGILNLTLPMLSFHPSNSHHLLRYLPPSSLPWDPIPTLSKCGGEGPDSACMVGILDSMRERKHQSGIGGKVRRWTISIRVFAS